MLGSPDRFGPAPTAEAQPQAPASSGGELARFEAPPAQAPSEDLDLATFDPGQPFVRCVHCGGDGRREADRCGHCDARLDTPEQRQFNEALWARLCEARRAETIERQELLARRKADQAERLGTFAQIQEQVREEQQGFLRRLGWRWDRGERERRVGILSAILLVLGLAYTRTEGRTQLVIALLALATLGWIGFLFARMISWPDGVRAIQDRLKKKGG